MGDKFVPHAFGFDFRFMGVNRGALVNAQMRASGSERKCEGDADRSHVRSGDDGEVSDHNCQSDRIASDAHNGADTW